MLRHLPSRRASGTQPIGPFLARPGPTICLLAATLALPTASAAQGPEEVTEILNRFAEDYRTDPMLTEPTVFGVRVDDRWWTIAARPPSPDSPAEVTVNRGEPRERTFFFFLDVETLRRLDRGELNARTALGKARHSDVSPMDIDPTDPDVVWDEAFNRRVNTVANHFWLRGTPEVLVFHRDASRVLHGANAVLLHYVQGLRSVWYQIETGQHINPDPRDQVNPFPSLFIFLNGNARARIDGVELDVAGGTATLVPAGVSHEFWNPFGEPFEFILIMFGEGA